MRGGADRLQVMCTEVGYSMLLVGHITVTSRGEPEERISGACLLEWARVVITADGMPRHGAGEIVHLTFEITGNSLEPITFSSAQASCRWTRAPTRNCPTGGGHREGRRGHRGALPEGR
jgi:hypothetical protein